MNRKSKIELLGVVLAGGQSIRMGTDKGKMLISGITWCEQVYHTIVSAAIPAVVSINESQIETYSEIFLLEKLLVDQDVGYEGPLKGVYSVHTNYPEKDLLVVAVDMVMVNRKVIEALIQAYTANSSYDFYAYVEDGFYIQTAAIYTAFGLKNVLKGGKKTEILSLQKILRSANTFPIQADLELAVFLKNYNSRSDIDFSQ